MKRPLVSFIIPVLNGEKDMARCLTSIRNQDCSAEDYEVLVVDNGSTDRTDQIVHAFGINLKVVPGVSVAALRNHGAETALGDYLAFVDVDVELAPAWLQNGLWGFRDRKVVAIGGPRDMPGGSTWVQRAWGLHLESHRPKDQPASVPWLYSMAFMVRRSEFLAIRGFADNLETAEDVDLCYRLGRLGTIIYDPAMRAIHWGEDPDLATFWNKEVWRGRSNLKGVLSHGLRSDELPSLGYPIYVLLLVLFLSLSCVLDVWNRQFNLTLISLGLLSLPALILATDTTRRVRKPIALPKLFLLYFIYGLARAYSIVRT